MNTDWQECIIEFTPLTRFEHDNTMKGMSHNIAMCLGDAGIVVKKIAWRESGKGYVDCRVYIADVAGKDALSLADQAVRRHGPVAAFGVEVVVEAEKAPC